MSQDSDNFPGLSFSLWEVSALCSVIHSVRFLACFLPAFKKGTVYVEIDLFLIPQHMSVCQTASEEAFVISVKAGGYFIVQGFALIYFQLVPVLKHS